jgi:FkbM family methyltransferase
MTEVNRQRQALRTLWKKTRGQPQLRRLVREAVGVTQVEYLGATYEVHAADNHTEFVLWLHDVPPEHEATVWLREAYAGQTMTIVDVGANAGLFSLPILAVLGPRSKVLMFEPNPRMRDRLARNIALNKFTGITVDPSAVGDREGAAVLNLSPANNMGAGRVDVAYAGGEQIEVAICPLLDRVRAAKLKEIDLLKVDIEGLEDRAIIPFLCDAPASLLPKRVYFEDAHSEHWQESLTEALIAKGYGLLRRFGENALYERVA